MTFASPARIFSATAAAKLFGLATLTLVTLLACDASEPEPASWRVVENERSPDLPWIRYETDLRIGAVTGTGPDVFGDIGAFAVSDSGRIYILDYHDQEIRAFEPDGEHLISFGHKGQGPGEMTGGAGLDLDGDGNLYVWDFRNARFSKFGPDGQFLDSFRREATGVFFGWVGGIVHGDWLYDFGLSYIDQGEGLPYGRGFEVPPYRMKLPSGRWEKLASLRGEFRLNDEGVPLPRTGALLYALAPDGDIVAGHPADYRIWRISPSGDTVAELRLGQEPMALPSADVDTLVGKEWGPSRRRIRTGDLPENRIAFRELFFAENGRLFVGATDKDEEGLKSHIFDIFDADGSLAARAVTDVSLIRSPLPRARGDTIYGVTLDANDVEHFVRLIRVPGDPR